MKKKFLEFIDGYEVVSDCFNLYTRKWSGIYSWKLKVLEEASLRSSNTSSAIENFDFLKEWKSLGQLASTSKMLYNGYKLGNVTKLKISQTLTESAIDLYLSDLTSFSDKIKTRLSESTLTEVNLATSTIKSGYVNLVNKVATLWDHFEPKSQASLKNTLQNMTFWLRLVGNVEQASEPYSLHSGLTLPTNVQIFAADMAASIIDETAAIYFQPLKDALSGFDSLLSELKLSVELPLKETKTEFSTYKSQMEFNENFVQ